MRIGLHSGEVVVGNIGAPGRINYTIVGDTVNIANRLEQMGKEIGGEDEEVIILLSGATARGRRRCGRGRACRYACDPRAHGRYRGLQALGP